MNLAEAIEHLATARLEAETALAAAGSLAEVDEVERTYLGKRSVVTGVNEAIKGFDASERPEAGKAIGAYRSAVADAVTARRDALASGEARARIERERLDLTLGARGPERGHLHLITQVQRELEDVFVGLGFQVAEGPEVETDWYNFEALNFPPGHPAREMQDTLYVNLGAPEEVLMRTHTSPGWVRAMEERKPPLRLVFPGRVYRAEAVDASHMDQFHQIDGLYVGKNVSMADLKATLNTFARAIYRSDVPTRIIPIYFPFVEPGVQMDVQCATCRGTGRYKDEAGERRCPVCKGTKWVEVLGAGMVHPNVFRAVGYDPEEVTGFAFGMGLERIAMGRYGIHEIRQFLENDIRFLEQF